MPPPLIPKFEILQGTLDLMVLKTLAAMGALHGYGIARRIEQISEEALQINQGTIYASLVRLRHKGWISAEWGTSGKTIAKPASMPSPSLVANSSRPKPRIGAASPTPLGRVLMSMKGARHSAMFALSQVRRLPLPRPSLARNR